MEQEKKFYNKKLFKILAVVFGILIALGLIIDTSAPEITLKNGNKIELAVNEKMTSEELVNAAVSKVDDNRSDMTLNDVSVLDYDSIDFSNEGTYKVKFSATDQAGNEETVPFTVSVKFTEQQLEELKAAEAAEKEQIFTDAVKNVTIQDDSYIAYFEASNSSRFQHGSAQLDGKKWKTTVYYLNSDNEPKNSDEIMVVATSVNYKAETMLADYKKNDDTWTYIDAKNGIETDEYGVPNVPEINDSNIEIEFPDFVIHLSDAFFEGYGINRNDVV